MTRTELIKLVDSIIKNPIDEYTDKSGLGYISTGLYMKRPMSVFLDNSNNIIAVSYNKVCYFIEGTNAKTAANLRSFVEDHNCTQKVYLYPEAHKILTDEDGTIDSTIDRRISKHLDYSDVIPIPYQA